MSIYVSIQHTCEEVVAQQCILGLWQNKTVTCFSQIIASMLDWWKELCKCGIFMSCDVCHFQFTGLVRLGRCQFCLFTVSVIVCLLFFLSFIFA